VDADWLHAHYVTSHGTLAWLAKRLFRLRARIVSTAWGSDILLTPSRSRAAGALTRAVLRASALTTSDSLHMTTRMRELGAREVMTFPLGLEYLPTPSSTKEPHLFYGNRGLEVLYRPERVLQVFAAIAASWPDARLVVANDGSLATALASIAAGLGLKVGELRHGGQVEFVGRLDAQAQDRWYSAAQWYLSLPSSDSVAVSVLEAMSHGCVPLLSDLPANRELVRDGENGVIVPDRDFDPASLLDVAARAAVIAGSNRAWVAEHAMFEPAVARFVARLREL
ncbi:MAG: glycosyltransferase, partial [Caldimonas sp.]